MSQFWITINKILSTLGHWLAAGWRNLALLIGSLFLGVILLIVLVIIFAPRDYSEIEEQVYQAGSGQSELAIVYLSGEIQSSSSDTWSDLSPNIITPRKTKKIFTKLIEAQNVKAVLIKINSGGGSVAASEEIYQQLVQLSQQKKVYVLLGEVAASGGYYLACAGEKIFASPATLTGSIGVISFSPDLSDLYDKLGVKITVFKTGEFKDMGNSARSFSKEESEIMNQVIDESYQLFIDRIATGRPLSREEVTKLADGRIYSAQQALANKLIDGIYSETEAIDQAISLAQLTDPQVIEYNVGDSFWSTLLEKINLPILSQANNWTRTGLYYLWQP